MICFLTEPSTLRALLFPRVYDDARTPKWSFVLVMVLMILMTGVTCYCRYGDGTMRMTVEQDVIFPNVPEKNLEAMQQEPMFQR